ncbi:GAF domain-containing protein [Corallococcus exiguus]|uniref:GAF domain-containing protein n=1 Tax=Corallococcus exiguus TaxID=83462 RepID=UPI0021532278|nr:GAF domain-containing protein [Corallococcus exiguus]
MLPPPTPADEPRRLQALRSLCLLDTPAHERFDRIVRAAAHLFRVPISLVSLVDENRQWFKARIGLDGTETPRELSFCAHAILSPSTFIVPDALKDPRFHDNPFVLGAPFVRFYAGHPLRATDGSRVGTLCLIDSQPRDFLDADRTALADMAAWAEGELNALDEREARTALEQQERFFEVSVDMLCIAAMDGTFLRLSRGGAEGRHHPGRAAARRGRPALPGEGERPRPHRNGVTPARHGSASTSSPRDRSTAYTYPSPGTRMPMAPW